MLFELMKKLPPLIALIITTTPILADTLCSGILNNELPTNMQVNVRLHRPLNLADPNADSCPYPQRTINDNPINSFTLDAQHGKREVGVLGIRLNQRTGKIWKVFPPSDLNKFGIHSGDKVLGYMGHPFRDGLIMEAEVVGIPGTPCDVLILHEGQIKTIYPLRIPANSLLPYTHYRHYVQCAAQDRFW